MRLTLLIIDTQKTACSALHVLQDVYQILYAESFSSGVNLARQYMPALLIVNALSEENDSTRRLKQIPRTCRIPVLAIIQKDDMARQSQSSGWDDFIQSPFEGAELLLRIRTILLKRLTFHERYVNFAVDGSVEDSREIFLKRIKSIIEANLNNKAFSVGILASESGVSQPQLYRKLIALTGFSPNSYIRHVRLKYAAQLLSAGAGNVSEIAWRVGFNSQSYFAKCFKALHRVAPREMRTSLDLSCGQIGPS